MFAQSVAATPGAPAIRHAHGVISYAELDQRAETMAAAIRTHVRGERPVVALLLPRGPELVVAMLAAWKAGCVFCPLDPVYPAARVRFILDDLEACAVVTDDPAALREANPGGVAVIDVAGIPAGHGSAPAALPDPESTAYVLYTSGTTGEPKGVAYSHRSLGHVTRWHIDTFGVGPADRISQIHSVAFDMAEYEIWPALCSGAELLPYEPPLVVPELVAWLGEQDVTMFFTPTPLAETLWADGTALPSLRWLIFAGSPLTGQPPATGYGICDAYGPTETYITTTHVLDRSTATALNCVGRPVDGVRLYVLDSAGNRCPIGIPGEIQVDGATVSQGYWRREDLTRQRFSALGPDGEPAWMYRTGDRGRWLPDGTVEYLGRLDRQLKVRGYRVEPQEIESQLRRDPLIRQAVVRTFPDDTAQLVAYLVAEDSAQADSSVVLARIKQQLPEFMVPDALVWLPELPMNSRGKLDTGRLPRPGRDDMAGRTAFQAPEAGLEQRIAGVWARVLGIGSVGAHDNFFDLGGNSLLLATLHSRLQEELSVSLPIRELFEYPTVQALAKALGSPLREEKSTAADAKDRASRSRARKARPTRSAKMGTSDE
jgi:amino acid adenylation domain-containing protein